MPPFFLVSKSSSWFFSMSKSGCLSSSFDSVLSSLARASSSLKAPKSYIFSLASVINSEPFSYNDEVASAALSFKSEAVSLISSLWEVTKSLACSNL